MNKYSDSTTATQESPSKMWKRPDAVANTEGGLAFKMSHYEELTVRTLACMFGEPKFYEEVDSETGILQAREPNSELLQLARSVAIEDPDFVLKLAAIARNDFHLRTIPTVLLTEVAILHGMKKIPKEKMAGTALRMFAPSILQRADEPAQALAYYIARNGSSLGNGGRYPQTAQKGVVLTRALRNGIEAAIFNNFDEYGLSKYNKKSKAAVTMKDVVNLIHPNPNNWRAIQNGGTEYWSSLFKDILDDKLEPAETWEDTLMQWKKYGYASKKDAWEAIIPKMGYMALLRNLRNFLEEDIHDTMLKIVCAKIADKEAVKKSKQFPYRFYTAYKMIEQIYSDRPKKNASVLNALEDAMTTSLENIPKWKGKTAVIADFSGSMNQQLSTNSVVSLKEVAALSMVMATSVSDDARSFVFANEVEEVKVHERSGILDNVSRILQMNVGGATEAYLAIAKLINEKIWVDRVALFSDMQCYNLADRDRISRDEGEQGGWAYHGWQIAPLWNKYKRMVNPNAYLYTFNLADYGTSVVPVTTHNLFLASGFSDKILEFVPMFEGDDVKKGTLVDKVKQVTSSTYERKHPEDENVVKKRKAWKAAGSPSPEFDDNPTESVE